MLPRCQQKIGEGAYEEITLIKPALKVLFSGVPTHSGFRDILFREPNSLGFPRPNIFGSELTRISKDEFGCPSFGLGMKMSKVKLSLNFMMSLCGYSVESAQV